MKPADISARAWEFGGGFTCSRYTQGVLARAFDKATADLRTASKHFLNAARDVDRYFPDTCRTCRSAKETLAAYTPGESDG